MPSKNAIPLGYVELYDGAKPIYPMNDIFLNYTFEDSTYWEALRLTANIIIEEYRQQKPETKVRIIEGKVKVRTQFQYLLGKDNTTRAQDIKITEEDQDATYLEFQNRARGEVPIEIRSVEYFGLGIGHSRGKLANQIWLLAKDVDTVLHGESFTRYILKDEITGNEHPNTSGIMYVSLTRLSKEKSCAGELASFLLGKITEPQAEAVKKISGAFKSSFASFKGDKEVTEVLTLAERYTYDGRAEGRAEGILKSALKLLKKGMGFQEVVDMLDLADEQVVALKALWADSKAETLQKSIIL